MGSEKDARFLPNQQRLPASFYQQEDVVLMSKALLGKLLVTQFNGIRTAGKIVETEAYRGSDDKACHAYNNRYTERTKVMYEAGGVAYVYLIYGIHHLFNVVTGKAGEAKAVLIRALEPIEGIDVMLQRRNMPQAATRLTAGPGVLSKALGIDKSYTGHSLLAPDSLIWLEDQSPISEDQIIASPRVGVAYAAECALWNWRFRIKDSKWSSKAK